MRLQSFWLSLLLCASVRGATQPQNGGGPKILTSDQVKQCSSLEGLKALTSQAGTVAPDAVASAAYLWIYGYPILAMAAAAVTSTHGVTNQFVTLPGLIGPGEDEKTGVVSTNSDTIYSSLWLDLSQGPLVISAPAMVPSDRFYVLPLLDMYTEQYASYGAVTTGTKAGSWVIMPPGQHNAKLPAAYEKLPRANSTTDGTWIIGRVYVAGEPDVPNVLKLWDQFKVEPISKGPNATKVADVTSKAFGLMGKHAPAAIGQANASAAYVAFAGLVKAFPPPPNQLPNISQAAKVVGLDWAAGFNQRSFTPAQRAVFTAGYNLGFSCINSYILSGNLGKQFKYGWSATIDGGIYGSNYLRRAAYALQGLGVQSNNVATYYNTNVDSEGRPLTGANGTVYTITFAKPVPTNLFSSLTIYQSANKFFVYPNPLNRPNIQTPRDNAILQKNKDGSVTLYISADPPGPKGSLPYSNWLPSGPYQVYLLLRVYGPKAAVWPDYTYQPPPFIKIK